MARKQLFTYLINRKKAQRNTSWNKTENVTAKASFVFRGEMTVHHTDDNSKESNQTKALRKQIKGRWNDGGASWKRYRWPQYKVIGTCKRPKCHLYMSMKGKYQKTDLDIIIITWKWSRAIAMINMTVAGPNAIKMHPNNVIKVMIIAFRNSPTKLICIDEKIFPQQATVVVVLSRRETKSLVWCRQARRSAFYKATLSNVWNSQDENIVR